MPTEISEMVIENEIIASEILQNGNVKCKITTKEIQRKSSKILLDIKTALNPLKNSGTSHNGRERLNITFNNISYHVRCGIRRRQKCILEDVNGEIRAGEITALMGPSGAGKSSLLDILAGYTTRGVVGRIQINGAERTNSYLSKKSCYIMQNEVLPSLLTVQESMMVACHLKLGSHIKQKQNRINQILDSLRLSECRNVMTVALSGGQRKRLAIALELVSNPPIMFFDEPTSGLDSSSSLQCVGVLKQLAREGHTIVCTIHQPSAKLFELFDHLIALSSGQCVYAGSTKGLVPFLGTQGLDCPPYHNPADFLLEVTSMVEYSNYFPYLVNAINRGTNGRWRKLCLNDLDGDLIYSSTTPDEHNYYTTPYPTSFWTQLSVLLQRNFKTIIRNKVFTQLKIIVHVAVALIVGTLYFGIGNDAHHIFDNFGFLFFGIMTSMFLGFSSATLTFPQEVPVLRREHFNRWYSLKAFFIAQNLSEIPVQLLSALVFNSVLYLMSGQPFDFLRYHYYNQMFILVTFVAQSFGYLVGVSTSIQNAFIFGPFTIIPFMIFSGYFVLMNDAPWYTKWLFHISFLKYGFEGAISSIYQDRTRLDCSADYCHFINPDKFLKQIGMKDIDYWFNFSILLLIILLLRVATYISLYLNIRFRRER